MKVPFFALLLHILILKDIFSQTTDPLSQEELLKNPVVQRAKTSCDAYYEQEKNYRLGGQNYETLGDCIWGGLSQQEQESFIKNPVDDKGILSPTVTKAVKLPHTEMEDRALLKFREHLKKKLAEAIQSSFSNDKETFIGILTIYDLYEQRMGKNIIESVSSFCLDADMTEGPLRIKEDNEGRLAQRKYNLSLLNTLDEKGRVKAYGPWERCIVNIAPLCYNEALQEDYTKKRACEVTNHLQAAKKGLIAAKKIKKALSNLKTQHALGLDVNIYTGEQEQTGINQATSLTSRDISESDHAKEVKDIERIAQECSKNASEECKQFLINDDDKKQQSANAFSSFSLQTKIRSEQMKQFIDQARPQDVEEMIQEELKNLGISEDKKQEFLDSLGISGPKEILEELTKKRYDAERKALNESIRERLNKAVDDGQNLGEELVSNVEEYKQLLHFNNIVSSFLKIDAPDKEGMRNTTSLALEIQNNAFDNENVTESDTSWGYIDHKTSEELQKLGQQAKINDDAPVLSDEEVNLLLGGKKGAPSTPSNP